ncbi:unnamed protein product [Rangifer tarandus platyrhynchus]|uniref:Uncharacterized protein n=1 Tax=Rangifer tarandus platyrhynchus TaxID=3082113 RepID=A0ABN8YBH0_RANTA|nr:unnamed protein product [Rangifer tarandus platyrhynchus]
MKTTFVLPALTWSSFSIAVLAKGSIFLKLPEPSRSLKTNPGTSSYPTPSPHGLPSARARSSPYKGPFIESFKQLWTICYAPSPSSVLLAWALVSDLHSPFKTWQPQEAAISRRLLRRAEQGAVGRTFRRRRSGARQGAAWRPGQVRAQGHLAVTCSTRRRTRPPRLLIPQSAESRGEGSGRGLGAHASLSSSRSSRRALSPGEGRWRGQGWAGRGRPAAGQCGVSPRAPLRGPGRGGPACRTPRPGRARRYPASRARQHLGARLTKSCGGGLALGLGDTAAAAVHTHCPELGPGKRGSGPTDPSPEWPQPGGDGAGAGGAIRRRCGRGAARGSGVRTGLERRGRAGGSRIPGGGAAARGDKAQTRDADPRRLPARVPPGWPLQLECSAAPLGTVTESR